MGIKGPAGSLFSQYWLNSEKIVNYVSRILTSVGEVYKGEKQHKGVDVCGKNSSHDSCKNCDSYGADGVYL